MFHSPKSAVISSFRTLLIGVFECFSHFCGDVNFTEAVESTKLLRSLRSLKVFGLHRMPLCSSKAQAATDLSGSPEQVRKPWGCSE